MVMKEEADDEEEGVTLLANVKLLLGTKLQLTLIALLVEALDEKVVTDADAAYVEEERKWADILCT